ncbi:MAG: hypothetical protein FJZ10_06570, partial [Candidatus Omnitrophica bacterium]|nr:hypothetical protein [Candidatus Omnitrophota bacterium]
MKTMEEEKKSPQLGESQDRAQKPEKRRFPAWVRVVAFIIVAVFLPEQVAWAIEYNPAVLYRNLPQGMQTPLAGGIVQGPVNIASELIVAENVKRSLNGLSYKMLKNVKLDENLEVENKNQEGIFLTKKKVDSIYNWLKDKDTKPINCGIQGLGYILKGYNVEASIEELSILTILTDILSGATDKFEGKLFTSLYSLSEVAKHYGTKLYPVELNVDEKIFALPIPFIVHIKNPEHFALVEKIEGDKVWLIQNNVDKPFSLPKDTFLSLLSGYFLLSRENEDAIILTKEEAQNVKGAPGDWGGGYDYSYSGYGANTYNNYYNNYNNSYNSYGYAGYDFNAVQNNINLTTPVYNTNNSFEVTVFNASKPPETSRTLMGFSTQYKDPAGGSVGHDVTLASPVTEYVKDGKLVRGAYRDRDRNIQRYDSQTILEPGKNAVAIPWTGVNWWKDVFGADSGEQTTGSRKFAKDHNISPKEDDRATVWVTPYGYSSHSINLDTAADTDRGYYVWNYKPMAATFFNPEETLKPGGVSTPPLSSVIPQKALDATVGRLEGTSAGSAFVTLAGMVPLTNAGVPITPGARLTWDSTAFKDGIAGFIPDNKFTPTPTQNEMSFFSTGQPGRSLGVSTNMTVENIGRRDDVRAVWVYSDGKAILQTALPLKAIEWNIAHNAQGLPKLQDLQNSVAQYGNITSQGIGTTATGSLPIVSFSIPDSQGYFTGFEATGGDMVHSQGPAVMESYIGGTSAASDREAPAVYDFKNINSELGRFTARGPGRYITFDASLRPQVFADGAEAYLSGDDVHFMNLAGYNTLSGFKQGDKAVIDSQRLAGLRFDNAQTKGRLTNFRDLLRVTTSVDESNRFVSTLHFPVGAAFDITQNSEIVNAPKFEFTLQNQYYADKVSGGINARVTHGENQRTWEVLGGPRAVNWQRFASSENLDLAKLVPGHSVSLKSIEGNLYL